MYIKTKNNQELELHKLSSVEQKCVVFKLFNCSIWM